MQNIIIQNNKFLNYLAIVSISDVKHEEADNVFAILSEAELISGMQKTRKSDDENFLLVTTTSKKYQTQVEADAFL